MTDKTQSQLKRTIVNVNPLQQQSFQLNPSYEELISRIQQTIIDTSESMKQQIIKYEQKQLANFKQDLFKTQQDFIKLRAQRNQQVIKNNIMKQKTQVQEKFNTQMKKSLQMNAQYDQMKNLMKKMTDQENQLLLQIKFLKKKVQKEKYQGKCLDFEINQLQNVKKSEIPKNMSKTNQEMKIFTDLANKCGQKITVKTNDRAKQSIQKPVTPPYNLNKKTENKLKQKIEDLKEYIENIPLDLNFLESKLYQAIQKRKDKKKSEIESSKISHFEDEIKQEKTNDDQQNLSTHQSNANSLSIDGSKKFKLPTLKDKGHKKTLKMSKSTNHLLKCTPKYTKSQNLDWNFSSSAKSHNQKSCDGLKLDEKISLLEYLPQSSELLQQILSDSEVKQYLYNLMFN